MAVQDKTDFRWDGRLAGAPNLLYYDLLNVDVVHTPYSTVHRNSSFFLKTRLGYKIQSVRDRNVALRGSSVYDVQVIWDNKCDEDSGTIYLLCVKDNTKIIATGKIENGCVTHLHTHEAQYPISGCGDYKLFRTSYVKGNKVNVTIDGHSVGSSYTGIQINKYTLGSVVGMFEDDHEEDGKYEFEGVEIGDYLLVYDSPNGDGDGFAGQVRMVTGFETPEKGSQRIVLDSPWLGFQTIDTSRMDEGEEKIVTGKNVKYKFFKEWGDVVGFTDGKEIRIITVATSDGEHSLAYSTTEVYKHKGTDAAARTNIVGVAESSDKVFVLTDNGYIHYSDGYGYNKFFINDDMFAGTDKTSIASYRNTILAFGRNEIAIGVSDNENKFWSMYNQSSSIGIWSRYAFSEYEGELLFVSNDKRLMSLHTPSSTTDTSTHGLVMEDRGDTINSKLDTLLPTDDVSLGNYDNELRIFVNTKSTPYSASSHSDKHASINWSGNNDTTHIFKYNTQFKLWTEDHIDGINMSGANYGVFYGENGIYIRDGYGNDIEGNDQVHPYKTVINAYLIENENNGMDSQPNLFMLAKLNRLITTLGRGYYTDNTRLHITSYWGGFGVDYEAPVPLDNKRLENVSRAYLGQDVEISECQENAIQDSQSPYKTSYENKIIEYRHLVPKAIWCDSYEDMDIQNHNVKINDRVYRMAPTMPLVTSLGENQNYSTQIKIELISEGGDVISFGGFLAELFIAPIGLTGPDGEYERKLESSC